VASQHLADSAARAAIVVRLHTLTSDSTRQWGRMTPHQAICHLSDSFRSVSGPRPIAVTGSVISRTVVKWIALHTPAKWPPGVKTRPEIDQEIGGTKPREFDGDRRELEALVEQFARKTSADLQQHPKFGRLSTPEWQTWGWRHFDHHLRQFGR
jgi:hypothetical protein